jgi:hypothetical protein
MSDTLQEHGCLYRLQTQNLIVIGLIAKLGLIVQVSREIQNFRDRFIEMASHLYECQVGFDLRMFQQ